MGRAGLAACALAACYSPSPSAGVPCGAGDTCPSGLVCIAGTCERPGGPRPDAPATDAAPLDAPPDAVPSGPWSMPVLVPGVNSSSDDQDPTLTADRLTIVFASNRDDSADYDLYLGTRASTAESFFVAPLTALNSTSDEGSPELSGDGSTLWFTSGRSGNGDVFVSTKIGSQFGTPKLVDELSSSTELDEDLALSPDLLTVLLARGDQLWRATRATPTGAFGPLALVPVLNIDADCSAPALTATTAYFHAGSSRDLYAAPRIGSGFGTPAPIAELNTGGRDASPFASADERFLWFERTDQIYESTR